MPVGNSRVPIDQPQVADFKTDRLAGRGAEPTGDRHVVGLDRGDCWPQAVPQRSFDVNQPAPEADGAALTATYSPTRCSSTPAPGHPVESLPPIRFAKSTAASSPAAALVTARVQLSGRPLELGHDHVVAYSSLSNKDRTKGRGPYGRSS